MKKKRLWEIPVKELGLLMAKQNVNNACLFWFYQPKIPHSAWKLKKKV